MQNVVWHYLAVISKTFLGKDRLGGPKPACNALLISNRVFNLLSINLIRSVGGGVGIEQLFSSFVALSQLL